MPMVGGALIELVDGTLLQFRSIWAGINGLEDEGEIFPCDTLLLEPCPWIAVQVFAVRMENIL
jgi:hypothetical protein